jgi:hypothetical protein
MTPESLASSSEAPDSGESLFWLTIWASKRLTSRPRQWPEIEVRIGEVLGGEVGDAAEKESEDKHSEDWLQDDPVDADGHFFLRVSKGVLHSELFES